MALTLATPGVYIEERSAFPNSVASIPTAIPAFIGFTKRAEQSGSSLVRKPTRITSLAEYVSMFGTGPEYKFNLAEAASDEDFMSGGKGYKLEQVKTSQYLMYDAMRLFYANGGGTCYVLSVGTIGAAPAGAAPADGKKPGKDAAPAAGGGGVTKQALEEGIPLLVKIAEPTMLVIPEAVLLDAADCYSLQQAMIMHCGDKMKSRVSILDVHSGYKARTYNDADDVITQFREGVGKNFLDYASAYYPWVETTIVQDHELSFRNIATLDKLQAMLNAEVDANAVTPKEKEKANQLKAEIAKLTTVAEGDSRQLHQLLVASSPSMKVLMTTLRRKLNLMPPSPAMAGLYTMTDNNRGVWKAPANISMNSVVAPAVNLSNDDQEDLNISLTGKSINAIRSFTGEGTIVWGARTLDGNSQDWRYVNVRRTMIYLEQSVKAAAKGYVFEPNEAKTWVAVKSMISNFLNDVWRQGGLAGASPEDAFSVDIGLGMTMTPVDILDGIMRVSVKVAISRPAEFIVITFEQQMQKS